MHNENKLIKDDIDLVSILSVLFDNFNLLLSILLVSVFVITIYYFSSERIYRSETLLEIKKENSSFLPESISRDVPKGLGGFSLEAEIEIYKSDDTLKDAYENLKSIYSLDFKDIDLSSQELRKNIAISTDDVSLINISFQSNNKLLSTILLDLMNTEFINDRADFARQSSAAGRKFINQEIPRIKNLLIEAEDNLNNFKISTNASDVIFDSQTTNSKLERLKNRVDEIEFKELELKDTDNIKKYSKLKTNK